MINREQIKQKIDLVNDAYLEILYRIIQVFKIPLAGSFLLVKNDDCNPLKDSVKMEDDLISPIDETWDVDR